MLEQLTHPFVTLFVTADPISIVPVFIVLTANLDATGRHRVALRSVIIAGSILIAFALLGNAIIRFFGITIPAFEIGGGLLLFAIAFRMVFDTERKSQPDSTPADGERDLTQMAVFPLAIPMMAGPGAISAAILLSTHRQNYWVGLASLIGSILVLMGLTYAVLMLSGRIDRALGVTGRVVVSRLLGVILAALAIQFIGEGMLTFASHVAEATS